MLKGVASIHITSNATHRGRLQNIYRNKACAQSFHRRLNISSVNGKSNRSHLLVDGLNNLSIVEEFSNRYWVQRPRIPRGQSVSCWSAYGLVCQEEEDDMFIREREREIGILSSEQILPPWGNVNQDGDNLEMIRDDPISDPESFVCKLELRLHFLEERDEEILSKRILGLSRCNKVRSALELYMSMEASGLQPSPHACNSLLSCLLRNGFLSDALEVFKAMKKEMTSGHTYSLIFKAIASARGCDSALKMFMELEKEGTPVNVFDAITFNTMITICGKANNWMLAERMWKSLKENGHQATIVTYNLLISTFVRCGQTELAFDAYSEMVQNGLTASEDTMQTIISACAKEGKWDSAYSVFQTMLKSGLNPNIVSYNALINSLGKAGEVELTFKVFGLMRSSGHTPDPYTWNALLGALNRGNRYMDALQLFESIKRNKSAQRNPHLYNTALLSCQRLGLWDRSLELLWQMEASDMPVSTESYNLVIGSCEAARKPKVALQVYEQMVHKKCIPNMFTYLSLVRACIWGSLWSEVKQILDHVPPDVSLYNAVIHGMCLRGNISSAKKMYLKMRESGLKPDGKTRSMMIQNLRKDSMKQNNRYPSHRRRH